MFDVVQEMCLQIMFRICRTERGREYSQGSHRDWKTNLENESGHNKFMECTHKKKEKVLESSDPTSLIRYLPPKSNGDNNFNLC